MSPKKPHEITTAQIARAALLVTLLQWVVVCALGVVMNGSPLSEAAILAAVRAILALVAWSTYRLLSRRNDGLAFFIGASFGLSLNDSRPRPTFESEISRAVVVMSVQIVVAALFGLWNRRLSKERPTTPRLGLWDETLDAPPANR